MANNGMKDLIVLLSLFIVGFLVHSQSLQMVLYGDDWRFIYNYSTHEEVASNFSPFSGVLAYFAPYGPSILTIGILYQTFGREYYIYYLVPLIFKILTSFLIFLTLRNIPKTFKKSDYFISFFAAALFLVGPIGIQAIDWAFHINVYIAIFIFVLGLFFQIRFYNQSGRLNLLLSLFLSLISIILAPFRLSPVALISPIIDLILSLRSKREHIFLIVILKNTILAIFLFIFFQIGLFGQNPGDIYSPFPITESIKQMFAEPLLSTKTFLHWVGVTILPAYPAGGSRSFIVGAIFLTLFTTVFYKYRSIQIILASAIFFIPLVLMWIVTPNRLIDSADRYLPLPFLGLCFLIGILTFNAGKLKKMFMVVILGLCLIQGYSTIKIYSSWISNGRGADFTEKAQEKIMSHFPNPIKSQGIIYLDFDDRAVQQSIEFGLGYRIALLSGTKGIALFPKLLSDKPIFTKWIQGEAGKGELTEETINNILAFQYKNKEFKDITAIVQEELRKRL